MFSRSLVRARLRKIQSVPRVPFRSTATSQSEKPPVWQPFNYNKAELTPRVYNAIAIAMQKKERIQTAKAFKRRLVFDPTAHAIEGTNEEILHFEVEELLSRSRPEHHEDDVSEVQNDTGAAHKKAKYARINPAIELGSELEFDIFELSSTGDGLAYNESKDHVVVIPFSVPGDRVLAKVYKCLGSYSHADFIEVIEPSKKREGTTPECKHFAKCGGCQLQMISYDQQLAHKKTIVEKAFQRFSGLSPELMPAVRDTMGSPLQYGYRTKLSPHFDGPGKRKNSGLRFTSIPKVGFNAKGTSKVMDIEQCPIGTDIVQEGLKLERAKVAANYKTYANGKTILIRESTRRIPDNSERDEKFFSPVAEFDTTSLPTSTDLHQLQDGRLELTLNFPTHQDHKTYTSIETSYTTEYIGPHKFVNKAGSFFQNNNSILGPFTKYVYEQCMLPSPTTTTPAVESTQPEQPPIKYLLDAYCGSGLFTIALSKMFISALGIDIDQRGIEAARNNAEINNISNAGFIEADASDLFADVPFPPDQSLVVIDPPRKGASADFLRQLCKFRAKRVIYVSCNVHTQARDVGMIVRGFGEDSGCRYEIESLRGFDFFPQTGHVEGVCVLNRVEDNEG